MIFCYNLADDFKVIASSMKLEYPMNDALPNTEHAHDRLLAMMFKYRLRARQVSGFSDEDFAVLYAYGECCD